MNLSENNSNKMSNNNSNKSNNNNYNNYNNSNSNINNKISKKRDVLNTIIMLFCYSILLSLVYVEQQSYIYTNSNQAIMLTIQKDNLQLINKSTEIWIWISEIITSIGGKAIKSINTNCQYDKYSSQTVQINNKQYTLEYPYLQTDSCSSGNIDFVSGSSDEVYLIGNHQLLAFGLFTERGGPRYPIKNSINHYKKSRMKVRKSHSERLNPLIDDKIIEVCKVNWTSPTLSSSTSSLTTNYCVSQDAFGNDAGTTLSWNGIKIYDKYAFDDGSSAILISQDLSNDPITLYPCYTYRDELQPTSTPTFSPTFKVRRVLSMNSFINITGVSSSSFDNQAQTAFIKTIATILGINVTNVNINKILDMIVSIRRLESTNSYNNINNKDEDKDKDFKSRKLIQNSKTLVSFTINAVTETLGYSDPNEMSKSFQTKLSTSINNSNFVNTFITECVNEGSNEITSNTVIKCSSPVFDNITITTVSTNPPTVQPTQSPTLKKTNSPTISSTTTSPIGSSTQSPTNSGTRNPTNAGTLSPTLSPISNGDNNQSPTPNPTNSGTRSPTNLPTNSGTNSPTNSGTKSPTNPPTLSPTNLGTNSPTITGTSSPTNGENNQSPTPNPTNGVTNSPTNTGTKSPTNSPSLSPTNSGTRSPTNAGAQSPTLNPTKAPTLSQPQVTALSLPHLRSRLNEARKVAENRNKHRRHLRHSEYTKKTKNNYNDNILSTSTNSQTSSNSNQRYTLLPGNTTSSLNSIESMSLSDCQSIWISSGYDLRVSCYELLVTQPTPSLGYLSRAVYDYDYVDQLYNKFFGCDHVITQSTDQIQRFYVHSPTSLESSLDDGYSHGVFVSTENQQTWVLQSTSDLLQLKAHNFIDDNTLGVTVYFITRSLGAEQLFYTMIRITFSTQVDGTVQSEISTIYVPIIMYYYGYMGYPWLFHDAYILEVMLVVILVLFTIRETFQLIKYRIIPLIKWFYHPKIHDDDDDHNNNNNNNNNNNSNNNGENGNIGNNNNMNHDSTKSKSNSNSNFNSLKSNPKLLSKQESISRKISGHLRRVDSIMNGDDELERNQLYLMLNQKYESDGRIYHDILDWMTIIIILIRFLYRFRYVRDAHELHNFLLSLESDHSFNDRLKSIVQQFEVLESLNQTFHLLSIIVVFIGTFQFFRYISFDPRCRIIITTLRASLSGLIPVLIIFLAILFAYAILASGIYGIEIPQYDTFQNSIAALFVMLLGDWNYYNLLGVSPIETQIFFWSFMILISFILFNMVIAIIFTTYDQIFEITQLERKKKTRQ